MAPVAQGHQIILHMGAAPGKRQNMVDFLGGDSFSGPLAPLAQRMGGYVPVADALPCPAISPLTGWIALIFVISRRDEPLVLLAISPAGEKRAAGIGTGALGFIGHRLPPPFRAEENRRNPRRLSSIFGLL